MISHPMYHTCAMLRVTTKHTLRDLVLVRVFKMTLL